MKVKLTNEQITTILRDLDNYIDSRITAALDARSLSISANITNVKRIIDSKIQLITSLHNLESLTLYREEHRGT